MWKIILRFHNTFIFEIWQNLAEILVYGHKNIVCIHASLCAWVTLCAQRSLVCSPDSIDTLISLIWLNLAEIWAYACKHIARMHASLQAWGKIMCSERYSMFSWFHRYLDLSKLTKFGQDIGLCTQAHSVHACQLACSVQIMCSERSRVFSWFHIYLDISYWTQCGWDMGICMPENSVHAH